MLCNKCGAEMEADDLFCGECGAEASKIAESSDTTNSKKEVKSISLAILHDIPSLLNYFALAIMVMGLIYSIFSSLGMDYGLWSAKVGQFFFGTFCTVFMSGLLLGLSRLITLLKTKE